MASATITRRGALQFGLAGMAALGASTAIPRAARAQPMQGDSYEAEGGAIVISPVGHASFVMEAPGMVIYNDPVGGAAAFEGRPPADLVLVSHEHGDHFDLPTLTAVAGGGARLVVNPAVFDKLPAELKARATSLGNGEETTVDALRIEAVPAYNTTQDRLQFHPKGRDNGYVLSVAGRRVYIAGDTEDIPEMRALTGIDIAFLPMNLPYTMDADQAAAAVAAFKPAVVYPYHYRGSDPEAFAAKVAASGAGTQVVIGRWYG